MTERFKIDVEYVCPPIPVRSYDWRAFIIGADENAPVGWGRTRWDAIDNLRAQLEELEEVILPSKEELQAAMRERLARSS